MKGYEIEIVKILNFFLIVYVKPEKNVCVSTLKKYILVCLEL